MTLELEGFLDPLCRQSSQFDLGEISARAGDFRDELVECELT